MALIFGMPFAVLFLPVQYLQHVLHWMPLGASLGYLPLMVTVYSISQFALQLSWTL